MGSFVHCNVQYLYFYFLMLLFMNHCNDLDPCGPSIGQYNSYSYSYVNCMPLEGPKLVNKICLCFMFMKYFMRN